MYKTTVYSKQTKERATYPVVPDQFDVGESSGFRCLVLGRSFIEAVLVSIPGSLLLMTVTWSLNLSSIIFYHFNRISEAMVSREKEKASYTFAARNLEP